MTAGSYITFASIAGFAGGWLFYRVWRALLPRGRSGEIFAATRDNLRGMLASEDTAVLLRHYRFLLTAMGRFAGSNLLAVAAAMAPIAVLFLLLLALNLRPFWPPPGSVELALILALTAGTLAAVWKDRAAV